MFNIFHTDNKINTLFIKLGDFELTHYDSLGDREQWTRFLTKEDYDLELEFENYLYNITRENDEVKITMFVGKGFDMIDVMSYTYKDITKFNKIIKDIISYADTYNLWN